MSACEVPETVWQTQRQELLDVLVAPDPLDTLHTNALRVILEHAKDHGLCLICGSTWPCASASLAEHNLAL